MKQQQQQQPLGELLFPRDKILVDAGVDDAMQGYVQKAFIFCSVANNPTFVCAQVQADGLQCCQDPWLLSECEFLSGVFFPDPVDFGFLIRIHQPLMQEVSVWGQGLN